MAAIIRPIIPRAASPRKTSTKVRFTALRFKPAVRFQSNFLEINERKPMPTKKVKLRDQKPVRDPKGGKHHHKAAKISGSSGDGSDPIEQAPGQIPGFPPKYTP